MNIKRVRRLWHSLGLRRPLRLKKPRKLGPKLGTSANSCVQQPARFKATSGFLDFIHDRNCQRSSPQVVDAGGRIYSRVPGVARGRVDNGSRCSSDLGPGDWSSWSTKPDRSDNGTEFICEALINWLPGVGAQSIPVAAGSPWENGYIESFHSRLRDEFLERVDLRMPADARAEASWYRQGI